MATSASIDLVFNAKNNTQSVFKGLNKELSQSKLNADKTSAGFASLGQSIKEVADKSVGQLRQGFSVTRSVMEKAFGAGIAGAASLATALAAAGQGTLVFGKQFKESVVDPLLRARSFLDNKSFLDVYTDQIIAASRESVTFARTLKVVGDSVAELANGSRQVQQLTNSVDRLTTSTGRFGEVARSAYSGFLPLIGRVLDQTRKLDTKIFETTNTIASLSTGLGGGLKTAAGYDEAIAAFDGLKQSAGVFAQAIGNVSQQIFFFQSAFQSVTQIAASSPFKLLIGQQVQLRQQLLETQSTLVATNKIVDSFSGQQLNRPFELGGDPGAAIVALSGATEAAIKQLRKDSLELVGVTSSQLAEVFNVTTTNLASVGIETENLLGDSADLTIKFAAALGTIGLPLNQARQEISSILQGTIDNNSALAKTLNLSNAQITKYKEQGNLLEKLNEKLKPFQAGNAIAAKSLEGVTSNIQEVFEVVALEAGQPLLDPLLEGLNQFYQFLADNQGAFVRFLRPVIADIERIRTAVFEAAAAVGNVLGPVLANIPAGIIRSAANFVQQLSQAFVSTLTVLTPFVSVLNGLVGVFGGLNNTFGQVVLNLIVFGKTVQTLSSSINLFLNLITGVGEIRFVLQTFTSGAIAQFVNLRESFSATGSAVLTLGLNFESLAKSFPAVSKGLADSLGGLKFLAPAITFLIPKVSALILGLSGFVKIIRGLATSLVNSIPKIDVFLSKFTLVGRIVSFVAGKIVASIIAIQAALTAAGFGDIASKLDDVAIAFQKIETGKFQEGLKGVGGVFNSLGDAAEAGLGKVDKSIENVAKNKFGALSKAAVSSAVSFGLWSIAIAGAGIALSEFLQRRQDKGQDIRDISDSLEDQAKAIKNIKSDNLDAFNNRVKDSSALTKDWVDKVILFDRNFKLANLSFENFGETVLSVGQIVGAFLTRLVAGVGGIVNLVVKALEAGFKAIAQFFISAGDGILALGGSLAKAFRGDIEGAGQEIDTFLERTATSRKDFFAEGSKSIKDGFTDIWDGFSDGFGNAQTKVELGLQQTADEIATGKLAASAKELGRVLQEELVPNDAKFKTISAELAESVADIGSASATAADRLNGVESAINQIRAIGDTGVVDPKAIQESITLLEDFKFEALDASGNLKDASEEGKEAFENQKAALRQALSLSLQQGRNVELGAKTDKAQADLTAVSDALTTLEEKSRAGVLTPFQEEQLVELRRVKAELEGIIETFDTLRQDTQPLADPVQLYANAIQKNEALLKRLQSKLTLEQQEETQAVIGSFLERRAKGEIVFTRNLEQEKNKIRKASVEKELGDIQKAVAEIQEKRDALTEFELERAEELDDQFTQLKTRQAQKQIELFEATIQEQQAIREEAERSIQEELQKTKNETEEIKLSVKEQELAYDGILKKIDQQNALLNEGRKLVDAQAQSALSGLDFLKENARSEARQKTLAETTAAIRLQSVREQIKFDEISLRLEQQKTELALQREAIAANISRLEAEAGLAQAQAELEKITLPGSEATEAERRAAEISVRAAAQQLRGTQQAERLIAEQASQQGTLFELQRRAFAEDSANKERSARFAAASAIASPTQRRRAIRGLEEEESKRVAGLIGLDPNSFDGITEFIRELKGGNAQFRQAEGFSVGQPSSQFLAALEAISPQIGDLTGEARNQAIADAARKLAQSTPFLDENAVAGTIPTGQQVQLQTSQPAILQQIFTPVQNTLGLAAENIGKAAQGFDTLITELRAIAAKPTYNLTVTAGGAAVSTGGAATSSPDLQRVLATAKRLVTNGLF